MYVNVSEDELEILREDPRLAELVDKWLHQRDWVTEYATEIERAREEYADDDLEIDDIPSLSPADDGVWVSAWVWVPIKGDDEHDTDQGPELEE